MAFWQLTVPSSPDTSEGLTNFLWEQGALGVVEEESPLTPPRLRAFFPDSASSTALVRSTQRYVAGLHALGFPTASGEIEIAPLLEEAWASAWQQSFPSHSVGRRLWITPPWEERDAPGRVSVIIEPGRAFGTGHHGSTEGILALAAIKLGVERVVGLDVDPDAIAAARTNAARNGCVEQIEFHLDGPETLRSDVSPFPLILANLLTHTHLAFICHYARLAAPGSALILGGMLEAEDSSVIAALEPAGFWLRERVVRDGWSALLLEAGSV